MKDEFAILRVAILLAAAAFVFAVIGHGIREAHEQRERMRVEHANQLRRLGDTNHHLAQAAPDCPMAQGKAKPGVLVDGSVAPPEPGAKQAVEPVSNHRQ